MKTRLRTKSEFIVKPENKVVVCIMKVDMRLIDSECWCFINHKWYTTKAPMVNDYGVFTVTGVLTIIQSFGLTSLVNLSINLILLIYMIHTLLIDTKIWKDFKLEKSPLNEIKSENYYYVLVILAIVLLTVNLIQTSTVAGAIVSLLGCIYTCILSRYIYLYKMHIDNKNALKAEKKEKKNIVKSKEKNNKTAKDNNKKQEDK